ncbi:MAG TPA: protein-glutamine glutaminase family protein [Bacteroidia bacterium]|jgi:hypothetical protein|nr:protein-glutamine glutaminase family protein [Bacteroidia bacterium]
MKKPTIKKSIKLSVTFCVLALAGVVTMLNSCTKDKNLVNGGTNTTIASDPSASMRPAVQNNPITHVLTVANIRTLNGSSQVMFNENPQVFNIPNTSLLASLQQALSNHAKVKITFNPWQAIVLQVNQPTSKEITNAALGPIVNDQGIVISIDENKINSGELDNSEKLGILNDNSNTHQALTDVIPNIATAELMFTYLARQCCRLGGPFNVDFCISFQYCEDGCYARAHKMCYVINTKYHYTTHKIFSFANAGYDELSVEAEKWGGCCINWWYHVAPLVNINTPGGVKAYVFDPAMFDQPVLLSTWLHMQENPSCAGPYNPNVSMINLQPTISYSPTSYSGYSFDTDPTYAQTDSTLVNYGPLSTCF